MRVSLALVVVVCLVGLGACDSSDGDGDGDGAEVRLGTPGDPLFGYSDNAVLGGEMSAREGARLSKRGGAEVLRTGIDWRRVEPLPGQYEFGAEDRLYRELLAQGIRPLWILIAAPQWARDPELAACPTCIAPPARRAEAAWKKFAAQVARRYPRSAGIEIWNEPNVQFFFQPKPDVKRYTRLQKLAYAAIKKVRPDMPVANGGLSNVQESRADRVPMDTFLEGIYENGGKDSMDAIAFHPYPTSKSDSLTLKNVEQVVAVRDRNGDAKRPLWATEVGATTTGPEEDFRWSEPEQARVLASTYRLLARVPRLQMVIVHTLALPPGGLPDNPEAGYALVRPNGSLTPAFCRLARVAGGRGAC